MESAGLLDIPLQQICWTIRQLESETGKLSLELMSLVKKPMHNVSCMLQYHEPSVPSSTVPVSRRKPETEDIP